MKQHVQVPHDMCRNGNLDPTDVLVYACLKTYMHNVTREAFPSLETMVNEFDISKSTILRSIKKLIDNNDLSIKKAGRRNIYKFNPDNRNFEMFTFDFIKDKSLSVNKRAYLIMLHQPMMEKNTGFGKISYTDKQLSEVTGLSQKTIKRRDLELANDGILTTVPMRTIDPETGLVVNLKLYDLQRINQAVLYVKEKLDEHDEKFVQQDKVNELLIREINRLRKSQGEKEIEISDLIIG